MKAEQHTEAFRHGAEAEHKGADQEHLLLHILDELTLIRDRLRVIQEM
jgi:hypothetical protein